MISDNGIPESSAVSPANGEDYRSATNGIAMTKPIGHADPIHPLVTWFLFVDIKVRFVSASVEYRHSRQSSLRRQHGLYQIPQRHRR